MCGIVGYIGFKDAKPILLDGLKKLEYRGYDSAGIAIEVYNLLGEKRHREVFYVDWDVSAAEKGGYEHFMIKEIFEEPSAVRATINPWP